MDVDRPVADILRRIPSGLCRKHAQHHPRHGVMSASSEIGSGGYKKQETAVGTSPDCGCFLLIVRVYCRLLSFRYRGDVDEAATVTTGGESNGAINESVEGVVLAHAHVQTGMVNGATLTLDDVACLGKLTTKNLNTESCALRLAAGLIKTNTFIMCHL